VSLVHQAVLGKERAVILDVYLQRECYGIGSVTGLMEANMALIKCSQALRGYAAYT
jgi:hypothetical protein